MFYQHGWGIDVMLDESEWAQSCFENQKQKKILSIGYPSLFGTFCFVVKSVSTVHHGRDWKDPLEAFPPRSSL